MFAPVSHLKTASIGPLPTGGDPVFPHRRQTEARLREPVARGFYRMPCGKTIIGTLELSVNAALSGPCPALRDGMDIDASIGRFDAFGVSGRLVAAAGCRETGHAGQKELTA